MIFRDPETLDRYDTPAAAVNAMCAGRACWYCPLHQANPGPDDAGCFQFAEERPEEFAKMFNLEIIDDGAAAKPKKSENADMVNTPPHYTAGGIECADALDAMVSAYPDPNAAALAWQVGKYIWRHPLKWNPLEDLKKARWYLDRLIAHYEKKEAANGN